VVVGEIDRLSARRRARGVWSEPVLRRNTLLVVSEVGYTGVLGSEAGWGGFGWVLSLFLPVVMLRSVCLERLDFCSVCEGPCTIRLWLLVDAIVASVGSVLSRNLFCISD
jgi:hypothetical protein